MLLNGMQLDFAELVVRLFSAGEFDIYEMPSIANQHASVAVDVARVEEVTPSGDGPKQEESEKIIEPDEVVRNDDKNWDLEGIVMAEEVEASRLQEKLQALQEKCRSKSVDVPVDMFAMVALTQQSLEFEHQMAKKEQSSVEVDQKLNFASSTAFSSQHSALAKAEEACKCFEELEDAKKQFGG